MNIRINSRSDQMIDGRLSERGDERERFSVCVMGTGEKWRCGELLCECVRENERGRREKDCGKGFEKLGMPSFPPGPESRDL